ncbi:hypothetical protein CWN52_08525 [Klebsiella michiganensis]|uniref:Uncharacterized protein n=1 Tax=Klebsiella michiganensis TaxID=1134687 RepID=A0A2J5U088_9ENTR|nr:hypothetical protein C2U44_04525 [Klebsiella oxytoca]MBX4652633.1 hypothetical protein [Klebsiella michiganensis]PLO01660.1 hypothetical protein CWN52_08525 [Klebsiella michiganensis]PLO69936.1 hypothetical protein CWN49_13205 [Klebsiella michiganensis]PLP26550.1 hypothetical protein CWM92_18155 [Klebsiella michiganensis]
MFGVFAPRKTPPASLKDADANVLFGLNLPPISALNHKPGQDITLAYDQNQPQSLQCFYLQKSD